MKRFWAASIMMLMAFSGCLTTLNDAVVAPVCRLGDHVLAACGFIEEVPTPRPTPSSRSSQLPSPPSKKSLPTQNQAPPRELEDGMRLFQQCRFESAATLLDAAARNDHYALKDRASALLFGGVCHYYLNSPNEAAQRFRQAIRLYPELKPPPNVFTPEAIVAFEEAIRGPE